MGRRVRHLIGLHAKDPCTRQLAVFANTSTIHQGTAGWVSSPPPPLRNSNSRFLGSRVPTSFFDRPLFLPIQIHAPHTLGGTFSRVGCQNFAPLLHPHLKPQAPPQPEEERAPSGNPRTEGALSNVRVGKTHICATVTDSSKIVFCSRC